MLPKTFARQLSPIRSGLALTLTLFLLTASMGLAQTKGQRETESKKIPRDMPVYHLDPARKGAPATNAPASISDQVEKGGISVEFSMASVKDEHDSVQGLVAGSHATISFRVTDKRTGEPVTGLHPAAWVSRRALEHRPNEAECKDKLTTFASGRLAARAEIDLNSFMLVTLNHDKTITFINPEISFNITKLESIIALPGLGADWTLSRDKDFLYVTMPDQSSVGVVNTLTRKLVGTISTGEKTTPRRVALQPDGRYVWVGLDDTAKVAVIDTGTNKLAAIVPAGAGLHHIAFTPDSRFAYVTNSSDDTVSVISVKTLTKTSDIKVGKTPLAIAVSLASGSVYVSAINDGTISVIRPEKQEVVKTIQLKRGVVAFKFEQSGRYGFAVNHLESTVSVIDASTNEVTLSANVVAGADQVTFTDLYAYIRGTETERFTLLELSEINKGMFSPATIQAGSKPPSASPDDIGVSDMIQPTPEGNSVMIANAPDQMIYYYMEGMLAPMGTLQNYKRRARALMVIDRSLRESAPGVYSSSVKLTRAGTFDVPFLIDQPRVINCFEASIGKSPLGEAIKSEVSTSVEPLFKDERFKPGEQATLRFRITDSITGDAITGLNDVEVLIFEPPGIFQKRVWAKERGEGFYEISDAFPHRGLYRVMTQIESRGIRFASLPYTSIPVYNYESVDEKTEAAKQEGAKND